MQNSSYAIVVQCKGGLQMALAAGGVNFGTGIAIVVVIILLLIALGIVF